MELLPLELLERIFLQLNIRQKLQCMLVCRHWFIIIRANCLYHTVNLDANAVKNGSLKRLMDRLNEEPDPHTQVKRLILEGVTKEEFEEERFSESIEMETIDAESFFKCFGNLDFIYLKHFQIVFENEARVNIHNQIATIIEMGCTSYSTHLFKSGLCNRLTSLTVNFGSILGSNGPYFSTLSNAPNLSNLTLSNFYISIGLLETIHNNLKKLETLDMTQVLIPENYNGTLPISLAPSPCMKTFFLQLSNDVIFSDVKLLDYVKKKYVNLEHFGFVRDNNVNDPDLDHDLPNFITEGLIPLLECFGSQLKTLKTSFVAESQDIIAKLDHSDCKLRNLIYFDIDEKSVFDSLYESNQNCHVQALELTEIGFLDTDTQTIYKLIHRFTYLVKLGLGYTPYLQENSGICLNHLLDSCPDTLEILKLSFTHLYFDNISEKIYTLKKLTLQDIILPIEFDAFLSSNCKHLRQLVILENWVCFERFLNLPDLRLECLNFTIPTDTSSRYISVTTLNNDKSYIYPVIESTYDEYYLNQLAEKHGPIIYNTIPKGHYNSGDGEICFDVKCGSLDNLIINAQIAF